MRPRADNVAVRQIGADAGRRVGTGQYRQLVKQPVCVMPGTERGRAVTAAAYGELQFVAMGEH